MNYIKELQEENKALKEQLKNVDNSILEIYRYLQSEKFYVNDMVNIKDMFLRLQDTRNIITE